MGEHATFADMAAEYNRETVEAQQREIRRLEADNAKLRTGIFHILSNHDDCICRFARKSLGELVMSGGSHV